MRLQQLTLAAFVAALAVGCSSTEETVKKPKPEAPAGAPEAGPGKQQQPPKDPPGDDDKKGGGGGGGGGNQVLDDLYKDLGLRDKEKRALAEHYFKVGKQY